MEKGTLVVFNTKRGFAVKISYVRENGKSGELPVPSFKPKDDKYNNTACTFKREGGKLVQLIAHDGVELISASPPIAEISRISGQSSQLDRPSKGGGVSDSFLPAATFLPKDTIEALSQLRTPDNFALKFNKAARADKEKGKFHFFKRERKGENFEIRANYGDLNFQQLADRELANAKRLLSTSGVQYIDLNIDWRMAQGLGIESVYETSLTLHHVYGIPYIPASSLKGVVRSWIITEAFGQQEGNAIQNEAFCNLFGCPAALSIKIDEKKKEYSSFYKEARQGKLVFFDSFPIAQPTLEVDVMNPHYSPYYSDKNGNTPPADYHNPIPVHFITVANTAFRFIIGAQDNAFFDTSIKGETVFHWLQSALTQHGIGAKTATGYGYFNQTT